MTSWLYDKTRLSRYWMTLMKNGGNVKLEIEKVLFLQVMSTSSKLDPQTEPLSAEVQQPTPLPQP